MPGPLNPLLWLDFVGHLPRPAAIGFFVTSLSMLVLGLRGFRFYVCFAAALGAYFLGTELGRLMYVTPYYVGVPVALVGGALAWPIAKRVLALILGFVLACCGGLVAWRYAGEPYWMGMIAGVVVGPLLGWLAPRFSTAVFCAAFGTLGALASLGAVVRAAKGPFAPGAMSQYGMGYIVAGTVVFLLALVLQVMLDDSDRLLVEGGV